MAKCDTCKKEMLDLDTTTCRIDDIVFPDGKHLPQVPYDQEGRCHDCGIAEGGVHHPGCDMERCPRCGGQLISCGCLDAENQSFVLNTDIN
jgi:hypothetical protein